MFITEIMETAPIIVHPKTTVAEVREAMLQGGQSRVIVVEEGRVVGIVTDTDLLKGPDPSLPVEEIMSRQVIKVYEDQSIREAGRLMLRYGVNGLPVVSREEKLLGVLTARNIVHWYMQDDEKAKLTLEGAAIYLAMTRSRTYEHYWLEKIQSYGFKGAITQVGTGGEKLGVKLRESAIAAAIARGVISEDMREKVAVSNAVRDAYMQLALINPGLGGGFKVSVVRGEGRVSVVIFGRFGHALADGPEQLAVGYSVI